MEELENEEEEEEEEEEEVVKKVKEEVTITTTSTVDETNKTLLVDKVQKEWNSKISDAPLRIQHKMETLVHESKKKPVADSKGPVKMSFKKKKKRR